MPAAWVLGYACLLIRGSWKPENSSKRRMPFFQHKEQTVWEPHHFSENTVTGWHRLLSVLQGLFRYEKVWETRQHRQVTAHANKVLLPPFKCCVCVCAALQAQTTTPKLTALPPPKSRVPNSKLPECFFFPLLFVFFRIFRHYVFHAAAAAVFSVCFIVM